jgi:hypothetical protein
MLRPPFEKCIEGQHAVLLIKLAHSNQQDPLKEFDFAAVAWILHIICLYQPVSLVKEAHKNAPMISVIV